jgi:hypothetical protein
VVALFRHPLRDCSRPARMVTHLQYVMMLSLLVRSTATMRGIARQMYRVVPPTTPQHNACHATHFASDRNAVW